MIVPIPFAEIVKAHKDPRIHVFDINGQLMFPIIAASGGILCAAMVYLRAGDLTQGIDLGRGGPLKHERGYTWGLEIDWSGDFAGEKLKAELVKFSAYLDEEGFR